MPVPLPTKPSELYGQPFSGHQSSHKRSHRKRATSAESRHVHYADEGPRQHVISQSGQLRPILRKSGSSQHLPQVRDEVRQTGDGRRVRVLSGGSTVPRPMYRPQLSHHPHFQYSKCTGRKKALCVSQRSEGSGMLYNRWLLSRLGSIMLVTNVNCAGVLTTSRTSNISSQVSTLITSSSRLMTSNHSQQGVPW